MPLEKEANMSGRIPWSRYSGEEVEKVLAAYICLENPRTTRIRPSRGDRGIDLISRHGDASIVYQIKKFSDNLTPSQKRQIEDSWKRLRDYASANNVNLSEWHLVMPLDPTPENDDWFRKMGETAGVDFIWDGLARVDAWAAQKPWVADYFFADGKEAERETIANLMRIASLKDPSPPEELEAQLSALQQRLDKINPYYSYSISVRSKYENANAIPIPRPGIVMASIHEIAGGGSILIEVFAKFDAAPDLCPITFSVSSIAGDEASRQAFENLLGFGKPALNVQAMFTGPSIDLPLPFAEQGAEGVVHAIPLEREQPAPCSLWWNGILSIKLERRYAHHGDLGYEWAGKDRSGFMEVALKYDSRNENGTFNLTVNHSRLANGWDPRELKRTTDFLSVALTGDVDFTMGDSKLVNLPFSELGIPSDYLDALSSLAGDLIAISDHATEAFELPPAASILEENAEDVHQIAMLLRAGGAVYDWAELSAETTGQKESLLVPSGPMLVKVVSPLKVKLAEKTIRCGLLENMHIGILELKDDGAKIMAKPHPDYGGKLIRRTLAPDAENVATINQMLVAQPPTPEAWFSEVQAACDCFKTANGLK